MVPTMPQSSLLEEIPQLEANLPAEQFMNQSPWMTVAFIATGVLLVVALILWWRRCRKNRALPQPPQPLDIANARLEALEAQMPSMRVCCMELSLIIREFLAGQAHDTSLYETHEEFTQRIDSLTTLPSACRLETQTLLNTLAEYKYTGEAEAPPSLARALVGQTRQLFQRIISEQQKEREQQKQREALASR